MVDKNAFNKLGLTGLRCKNCDGFGYRYHPRGQFEMKMSCGSCFGTGMEQLCDVCQKLGTNNTIGSRLDEDVFIVCCRHCCRHCYPSIMGRNFPCW